MMSKGATAGRRQLSPKVLVIFSACSTARLKPYANAIPCALLAAGLCFPAPMPSSAQSSIELISATDRGFTGDATSGGPAVSTGGRFVAFFSDATDLVVPNDRRPFRDVFVRDRENATTERISVAMGGGEANGNSHPGGLASPGISADGCLVVFSSEASNLVPDDDGQFEDVFIRDRCASTTRRISVATDGGNPNGRSNTPDITPDGRWIVFQSQASNLVDGDTNGASDIFLYDNESGELRRVSVADDGEQANSFSITPSISHDGRSVAFASMASNLVPGAANGFLQIYVRDLQENRNELASVNAAGVPGDSNSFCPDLNGDGSIVAFKFDGSNLVPGDTNGVPDVIVRDRANSVTERVSVDDDGIQGDGLSAHPAVSRDGRYVVFPSFAERFDPLDANRQSDIFVYDRETRTIARVSVELAEDSDAGVAEPAPSISPEGKWIGFASGSSKLVENDINTTLFDVFFTCNPLKPPCPPACTFDRDCPEGLVCDPETSTCVECADDEDCPEGQVCDEETNTCVECTEDADCPEGQVCDEETNTCVECTEDADCPEGEVCDPETNTCVECLDDEDCPEGLVCNPETNTCVECLDDEDCPEGEICDPATMTCVECLDDEDCEPGEVCIDGECIELTPTSTPTERTRTPTASATATSTRPTATPTSTTTSTPRRGGGGGGCNCEIDPDRGTRDHLESQMLALLLPALLFWLRRRSRG